MRCGCKLNQELSTLLHCDLKFELQTSIRIWRIRRNIEEYLEDELVQEIQKEQGIGLKNCPSKSSNLNIIDSPIILFSFLPSLQYCVISPGIIIYIIVSMLLNLVMRRSFSSLVMPQRYVSKFNLRARLTQALTVSDLHNLIDNHKDDLIEYCRPTLYSAILNFPMLFFPENKGLLQNVVWLMDEIKEPTIAELQLKYRNLSIIYYSHLYVWKNLQSKLEQILKQLEQAHSENKFQFVDSLSFIVLCKHPQHPLLAKTLQDVDANIDNFPQKSLNLVTSLIAYRMVSVGWNKIHKLNNLLKWLMNYSKNQIGSQKINYNYSDSFLFLECIAKLQLDKITRWRVPRIIEEIINYSYQNLQFISRDHLAKLINSYQYLPINYKIIELDQFIKQYIKISPQSLLVKYLPYKALKKEQINQLLKIYIQSNGIGTITKSHSFVNSLKRNDIFTPEFCHALTDLYEQFFKADRFNNPIQFNIYVGLSKILLQKTQKNYQKSQKIIRITKNSFAAYKKKFSLQSLMKGLSLTNYFNLISLVKTLKLQPINKQLNATTLGKSHQKYQNDSMYLVSLIQTIHIYGRSPFSQIRQELAEITLNYVKCLKNIDFNQLGSSFIFNLYDSYQDFFKTINILNALIPKSDQIALILAYIRCSNKSSRKTQELLKFLIERETPFQNIAKLIGNIAPYFIINQQDTLQKELKNYLQKIVPEMNTTFVENLDLNNLTGITQFCQFHFNQTKDFSIKFLKLAIEKVYQERYRKFSPQESRSISAFFKNIIHIFLEFESSQKQIYGLKLKNFIEQFKKSGIHLNIQSKNTRFQLECLLEHELNTVLPTNLSIQVEQFADQIKNQHCSMKLIGPMITLIKLQALQIISLNDELINSMGLAIKMSDRNIRWSTFLGEEYLSKILGIESTASQLILEIITYSLKNPQFKLQFQDFFYFLRLFIILDHKHLIKELYQNNQQLQNNRSLYQNNRFFKFKNSHIKKIIGQIFKSKLKDEGLIEALKDKINQNLELNALNFIKLYYYLERYETKTKKPKEQINKTLLDRLQIYQNLEQRAEIGISNQQISEFQEACLQLLWIRLKNKSTMNESFCAFILLDNIQQFYRETYHSENLEIPKNQICLIFRYCLSIVENIHSNKKEILMKNLPNIHSYLQKMEEKLQTPPKVPEIEQLMKNYHLSEVENSNQLKKNTFKSNFKVQNYPFEYYLRNEIKEIGVIVVRNEDLIDDHPNQIIEFQKAVASKFNPGLEIILIEESNPRM